MMKIFAKTIPGCNGDAAIETGFNELPIIAAVQILVSRKENKIGSVRFWEIDF